MGIFQSLLLMGTKPLNKLEIALMAFVKGGSTPEQFEAELRRSKVVILLKEAPGTGAGIRPLVINGAGGAPGLCVFTHKERSLAIAKNAAEYPIALETEFEWVLSVTPPGVGMIFNAGTLFSTEVVADGVDAMRSA
ncbi:MAG: SseB family protein [Elusimicrobia bacterium]|nr:SseB family protein [Elusimicrobiota bacterium]